MDTHDLVLVEEIPNNMSNNMSNNKRTLNAHAKPFLPSTKFQKTSNDNNSSSGLSVSSTASCDSSSASKTAVADRADPVQRRIRQRQKMIAKGKNTVGYATYRRRIALDQRRRGMETPSTPDANNAKIPNKRWKGMVKAWRIALHRYDPDDLVRPMTLSSSLPATTAAVVSPCSSSSTTTTKKSLFHQEQPETALFDAFDESASLCMESDDDSFELL